MGRALLIGLQTNLKVVVVHQQNHFGDRDGFTTNLQVSHCNGDQNIVAKLQICPANRTTPQPKLSPTELSFGYKWTPPRERRHECDWCASQKRWMVSA